jgi:hypothetical protein
VDVWYTPPAGTRRRCLSACRNLKPPFCRILPVIAERVLNMVTIASITGSSCHPRNEDISRIQLALRYVKRQIHLIDESAQCILWQLREVQRLESLGETDLPITVPELIKKLIVLESEINLIVKTMATITVSLSINDKKGRHETIEKI